VENFSTAEVRVIKWGNGTYHYNLLSANAGIFTYNSTISDVI
jgi:hypothetical protein